MTARNTRVGGVIVGALALIVAAPASAGVGDGIRLGGGDGVVHPFVEVSAGFDSNVFSTDAGTAESALVFHFRPGLKLDVPGEMVLIDARAALEWVQYAAMAEGAPDISGLWGDAGLRLSVNPKGRVAFELREAFRRSNQVQALSLATPAIANYNMLSVSVPFMPGGGALVFALGGDWAVEAYEPLGGDGVCSLDPVLRNDPSCDTALLKKLGYSDIQGRGSAIWKFLPRTQATLDLGYSQRLPTDETRSPKISTLRALAGVSGLVTTQFGATIRGGYGASSGTGATGIDIDAKTWLATVEAEWLPVAEASVKLGYSHVLGTEPSDAYAVYTLDRFSADAQYKVARRYTARLGARMDNVTYKAGTDVSSTVLTLEPSVKAEVAKWLHTDVAYTLTKRDSSGPAGMVLPETFNYTRHAVLLRASVLY